ncbi:unnamed protein product [Rotaria socialis]|uniref:Uncharacterized protein n=1 Tax=Rotaria socialis TaxID=392032 RepID=A0A820LLT1_9BILA|nr:unnamed protein product [Rotaria socialis]CAF3351622.1 unnamed protein product [Rotaria socialis]CAF3357554.1 unnamed protein product [Rotaria socialis]CAF3417244.1 unnamed protein product [Rotaria socialis]CAF3687326.1 unnamed protein product [Rotaria socialis]
MASSLQLHLFHVCFLISFIDLASSKIDLPNRSTNESPIIELSIYPSAGAATERIQVRCEILQSTSSAPLSSSQFEPVYLSVKTGLVRPSGILIMFDDITDVCRLNRPDLNVDVCNASLILFHVTHTVLNETLDKIDYSCIKGSTTAIRSYRIKKDQSARYYDQNDNSSSCLVHSSFLLVFVLFIHQIIITRL